VAKPKLQWLKVISRRKQQKQRDEPPLPCISPGSLYSRGGARKIIPDENFNDYLYTHFWDLQPQHGFGVFASITIRLPLWTFCLPGSYSSQPTRRSFISANWKQCRRLINGSYRFVYFISMQKVFVLAQLSMFDFICEWQNFTAHYFEYLICKDGVKSVTMCCEKKEVVMQSASQARRAGCIPLRRFFLQQHTRCILLCKPMFAFLIKETQSVS